MNYPVWDVTFGAVLLTTLLVDKNGRTAKQYIGEVSERAVRGQRCARPLEQRRTSGGRQICWRQRHPRDFDSGPLSGNLGFLSGMSNRSHRCVSDLVQPERIWQWTRRRQAKG